MEQLKIDNLSVKYRYSALAVSNLSFSVNRGDVAILLGENEAGKTTALKCIAGLQRQIHGNIIINDTLANNLSVKDRNICYIYEKEGFFENKTAQYNLRYPLKRRKINDVEIDERMNKALKCVEFPNERLNIKVKQLNNDERVKLSFARAFLRDAEVYLIDNPLNVLDGEKRRELYPIFKKLIDDLGKKSCAVYATNVAEECIDTDSEIIFLNYGITIQKGKIDEIKSLPKSLTAVKYFSEGYNIEKVHPQADETDIYIEINGEKRILKRYNLISEIFIGKECYCINYINNRILLYDFSSENLIYYE